MFCCMPMHSVPTKGAYMQEFRSEIIVNPLTSRGMVRYKGIVKVKYFIMQLKIQASIDQ